MTADVRRIRITAGNLKNNTLYVAGLGDFFPTDAVGGPRLKKRPKTGTGSESSTCLSPFSNGYFELTLDGLNKTIVTDIGSEPKTDKACRLLRCRSDIGKFFKNYDVQPGVYIELQRRAERKYRPQGLTLCGSSLCVAGGDWRTSTL